MRLLLELYFVFFRIGVMTFGGGYAMITLIQHEVVLRGYCTNAEFADMVALSQMTPGAVALNAATYLGKSTGGFPGALAATMGLVTPALIVTTTVLWLASRITGKYLKRATRGVRAAAAGLIFSAVWFFAETSLFKGKPISGSILSGDLSFQWPGFNVIGIVIFLLAFFIAWKAKLASHWVILISLSSGLAGYFIGMLLSNYSPW